MFTSLSHYDVLFVCHFAFSLIAHLTFFTAPEIARQRFSHNPGRSSEVLRALLWTMCRKIYLAFYEKCNCVYQPSIPYIKENGYRIAVRTQLHLCVKQLHVSAIYNQNQAEYRSINKKKL